MAGKRPYTPRASTVANKIVRMANGNGKRHANRYNVSARVKKMSASQLREAYSVDDWEEFLELDITDDEGNSLTRYH